MTTAPDRSPTEAYDLVAHAVELRRRGAPPVTVLAVLDQARASIRHEPRPDVAHHLWWACRALAVVDRDEARIDAAMRRAARDLL